MRILITSIFEQFRDCDTPAYLHNDGDLSFAQLYQRAAALSHKLHLEGAVRSPVVIWGHKHHSYHVAYWACLLAGRPLIPVEPDTPMQRLTQIVETCGAGLVLCTEAEVPMIRDCAVPVLNIRDFDDGQCDPYIAPCTRGDPAYIMYSSGSSGTPKGIKVSYGNLEHFIDWLKGDLFNGLSYNAISGTVRHCFDVSLFELWGAWLRKKPIVALDHRDFINSRKYVERLADHEAGIWVSTPSTVQAYLKDKQFNAQHLPTLNTFVFCGEVLSKPCVRMLNQRFPGARVINTYGPTECTVAVTSIEIKDQHVSDSAPLPIGVARDGCVLSLSDGGIIISGESVGLGYVALPEKTAKAFPTSTTYLTGDAGLCDAQGVWHFSGRMDREIKILGHRIDPSEIEEDLMKQDNVQSAFVEPFMVRGAPRALRAYVFGPDHVDQLPAIAARAAQHLPPAMAPKFWHLCPALEHNQNSKIDKEKTMALAHTSQQDYTYSPTAPVAKVEAKTPPVVEITPERLDSLGFLRIAENAVKKQGPIVTLQMPRGGRSLTLLADPSHVRFWQNNEFLFGKDHTNANSGAAAMRSVLGKSLQTSRTTEGWSAMRREMAGLLSSSKDWFQRPLQGATSDLIAQMQGGSPRPLMELCLEWATRAICDPLFQNQEMDGVACDLLQYMDDNLFERMAAMAPSQSNAQIDQFINQTTRRIADAAGPDSIATRILETDKFAGSDEDKLRRIVAGLLVASLHMNRMTLFWALVHMAEHPELQDQIAREAEPFGFGPRRVSQTPISFATLREVVRVKPVTAFIERQVEDAFELGGYMFKPGQSILFSPLMVQMNPDVWDDPQRFDPTRFIDKKTPDRAHYLPYGIGQRVCPGIPIVHQQLTYALSTICQSVDLKISEDTRLGDLKHMFKIVLVPRGPVRLEAKQRAAQLQEA